MELDFFIPSQVRQKVLRYFSFDPEAWIHVNGLARELGQSPQAIYRELIRLENWGFLFSSKQGNQRVYRLNEKFPYFPAVKSIFFTEKQLKEQRQKFKICRTWDLYKRAKELKQIPIPAALTQGLQSKRRKPRSFGEEKLLEKYGEK